MNTAYSISKIFLSCGLINENDLMLVAIRLMEGNFQLGEFYGQDKDEEEDKEEVLV